MPLIFNGTTIKAVTYNGTALDKVIYNGTTVWESWVLKTGQLYNMTSATTPSPFVVTGGSGAIFQDPYTIFNTSGDAPVWNSGGFNSPIINLSKKYIPTKFYFSVGSNTAQGNQTWYIQGSTNGSTWVNIASYATGNVGGGWGNSSGNPTTGLTPSNTSGYQYLRLVKPSSWEGQVTALKLRTVEWYQ